MVGQVAIAVMLTISESSLIRAGQVMGVDIRQEGPGDPITFITAIRNQGNVHFRPSGEIIISQDGQEIGRIEVDPHLIIPGYTRPFKSVWAAPEVSAGAYSFEVILNMDGTELKAEGSFTLNDDEEVSDSEWVVEVEGGVGEPGETIVPAQQQSDTSSTTQSFDWRLIVEIIGGVLIVGILIYLIITRRRAAN